MMNLEQIKAAAAEELEQRKSAIREELNVEGADLDALEAEARDIAAELETRAAAEEQRQAILASVATSNAPVADGFEARKESKMDEREVRANALKETGKATYSVEEMRSILVSGGTLATPTAVSGINDMVGGANNSLLDMIYVENCEGMGTHRVALVSAEATAADQTEGSAASSGEPTFNYVDITPTSIATTSQISKQAKKQSPLQYEAKINALSYKALRTQAKAKVIAALKAEAVKAAPIIAVTDGQVASKKGVIDAQTLRKIVFAFGGDEEVGGNAVLLLSKNDLVAFGDVRGTNEKKGVYEITPDGANPNTGIIKDGGLAVKYVICSGLTTFAGTTESATAATPTMFYGDPMTIELDLFSDYAINVSTDFAFTSLMDTILGDCEVGVGLVKKNGLVAWMLPQDA